MKRDGCIDSWIGGTQRAERVMRTWPMSSGLTRLKLHHGQVSSCRLHHGRSGMEEEVPPDLEEGELPLLRANGKPSYGLQV